MKRITRDRRLTADEAAKYRAIREQVEAELPELIVRHHQHVSAFEKTGDVRLPRRGKRE